MRVLIAFALGVLVGVLGLGATIDLVQDGTEQIRAGACSTDAVDCVR